MKPLSLHLVAALGLVASACSGQQDARPVFPRPTENRLDEEAEERQTTLRKAWFEHRHQAGLGVDWRALERANGEAQTEKRNRLGLQAFPIGGRWIERGSDNLAGRVHAAALS